MKTRGLTKYCLNLLRRYAVIDDEVEPDLGQRKVKFLGRPVDRVGGAAQVGAQIDDWNDLCVGHPPLLPPAARTRMCLQVNRKSAPAENRRVRPFAVHVRSRRPPRRREMATL